MARRAKTAIVGVGHTAVHRRERPGEPLGRLAIEASLKAIADAGLSPKDIDGIAANAEPGPNRLIDGACYVLPESLAGGLGLDTRWGLRVASPTFATPMIAATHAVASGACRYALVYRAMHNPAGRYGLGFTETFEDDGAVGMSGALTGPYGPTSVSNAAFLAQQYLHRYGKTREDLGAFVVRNRERARLWERGYWAQHRAEPITLEDYLDARPVASPLGMYDCDMPVQACAAWIITSAERAKDLRQPPAYILGTASPFAGIPNRPWTLEDYEAAARKVREVIYENAGVGLGDYQVANVYDGFSIFPPIWIEALGLAEPGQGLGALVRGWSDVGRAALQTSSGNLGNGRMPGAPQITESVLQVMNRAGPRQIENVQVSLASVSLATDGNAFVFGRDP